MNSLDKMEDYDRLAEELAAAKQKLEEAEAKLYCAIDALDERDYKEARMQQKLEALEAERKELEKHEPEAWIVLLSGEYSHIRDTNPALFEDAEEDGQSEISYVPLYARPLPAPDLQKRVDELESTQQFWIDRSLNLEKENAELTKKLAEQQGLFLDMGKHPDNESLYSMYMLQRNYYNSNSSEQLTTLLSEAEHRGIEEGKKMADGVLDSLHHIKQWCEAYPLDIFPEPDFKKAHAVLKEAGMTLDAISASNMRHVLNGIVKHVDDALLAEAPPIRRNER